MEAMGLSAEQASAGCCGMAGSFGHEAGERYRVSMGAGEQELLPRVREAGPGTLVVADGFSCRSQISDATGRQALHLAEVLDLALRQDAEAVADFPERLRRELPPAPHRLGRASALAAGGLALAGAGARAVGVLAGRRARSGQPGHR